MGATAFKYFPYFRAKQSELLAVEDVAARLEDHGAILPILEPVTANNNALRAKLIAFDQIGLQVCLVLNPRVGLQVSASVSSALEALLTATTVPGFQIYNGVSPRNLTTFLNRYQNDVVLIHWNEVIASSQILSACKGHPGRVHHVFIAGAVSAAYVAAFSKQVRISLEDGFRAMLRNADYPPHSFYSDLWHSYGAASWDGFGDFLIVGETYRPGGGPAHAVTIHMTHDTRSSPSIHCEHFMSDDTVGVANPGRKYLQALRKLVAYTSPLSRWNYSTAVAEFHSHHGRRHFPNLGTVKRLSMRHHLELMMNLI